MKEVAELESRSVQEKVIQRHKQVEALNVKVS